MIQTVEIDLEFQEYIQGPPETPKQLFQRAAQNDGVTIDTWRDIWLKNIKYNHDAVGSFADNGIGRLYDRCKLQPAIVVGSGPSLKKNVKELARAKAVGIPIISCLHNFHFLEDNGAAADFYVNLDAGDVTFSEISEGGQRTEAEYLELSKGRHLLSFIGASPLIKDNWEGEISWFNSPIPDPGFGQKVAEIENFNTYVSTGGNVLGASFYIARAIMGANPIIFVGADFSFSYSKKFHGWESKYDKTIGNVMRVTDVFGNKTATWPSYYGFKCWFDSRACVTPGIIINATEGGIFGAYPEGNISQVRQMYLKDVVDMYDAHKAIQGQCVNPQTDDRLVMF
jgi:hypothetical protein